jgi:hypothetical protein
MRRWAAALVLAAAAAILPAGPAAAHTVTGVNPTNYCSQILSVPNVPGLEVRLLDLGRRVELVNNSPTEIVVLGYDGEPYLRIGPKGVYQNERSPATYVNKVAPAGSTTTLPPQADATATPSWTKISDGHSARWRDRRTRWEGKAPPAVRHAPRSDHVVSQWTLPLTRGGTPLSVAGQITYVPGPSVVPWVVLAVALAAGTIALAFTGKWGPALSAVVALLVAVDVMHTFSTALASRNGIGLVFARVFVGGIIGTAAWIIGIAAIVQLQEYRVAGLVAAGSTGLIIALYGGIGDAASLVSSQVPTVLPATLARVAIAVSLGLGAGLVVALVIRLRREPAQPG